MMTRNRRLLKSRGVPTNKRGSRPSRTPHRNAQPLKFQFKLDDVGVWHSHPQQVTGNGQDEQQLGNRPLTAVK